MHKPELSIVVPFLNEREELAAFLADIARQQQVDFELLLVDGGSTDGGVEYLQQIGFNGRILPSHPGRGRQLNSGAKQAQAEWLLFLHVDSRFADSLALRKALDVMLQTEGHNKAGHFALSFRRAENSRSLAYYFYEWKARLGRAETIHGDQGFLLHSKLFQQLKGFAEAMTVMEDTDFAERLRVIGHWHLLPAQISTSARRFETEGLWQRQLLGSLIMCFRDIGWEQFFSSAADVYRQQAETDRLCVRPFFLLVRQLLATYSWRERWLIWWRSGRYIRRHCWQLFFALDARNAYRRGIPVGQGRLTVTSSLEPLYDFLTDNLLGGFVATLLLRLWFECTDLWLGFKEAK